MKNKQLLSIAFGLFLLLGISLISAQNYQVKENTLNKYTIQEAEVIKNQFQNRYMLNCSGECEYKEIDNKLMLEVRQQKKFLFFNVEAKETYELNELGMVTKAKVNFWSRLLNMNRVRLI